MKHLTIASFPGSGQNSIQSIATDSDGNVYVAGATSSPDLPVKNAAQPQLGEARILRTNDLGLTWVPVGSPADVNIVTADPEKPEVLFAAGVSGVYKSSDGGRTWRRVYQFEGASVAFSGALVIDPGNHLRLAAVDRGKLIFTVDGGETWTAGGSGCPLSSCPASLVADPTGSGALLAGANLSRDWGKTFQPLRPPGQGSTSIAVFVPSHPGWIYAARSAGVAESLALSTDWGATWAAKASPRTAVSSILYLAVDPDDTDTLVAAGAYGLYKSSDGAASWSPLRVPAGPFGAETHAPFALLSHACTPAAGLFALGSSMVGTFSVAFSPDQGATWKTPQLTGVTSVTAGPGCAVYVTRQSATDAFVSKLAPDGTVLWTTFLGGSDRDAPVALALDGFGNAYVAGRTASPDFPATAPRIGERKIEDVFVSKLSSDGALEYSVLLGGDGISASAVAVDRSQNVYVVGSTKSLSINPGTLVQDHEAGTYAAFLVKLSSRADLVYATYLPAGAGAILVDANEQVILAGSGPVPGSPAPPPGTYPPHVMRLDAAASQVISSTVIEGINSVTRSALAADADGNLFVSGFDQNLGFYALKLTTDDWKPLYRVFIPVRSENFFFPNQSGPMIVDRSGGAVLSMSAGAGFPLLNPIVAGPACGATSSVLARLSPDGSLDYATYLDNCGAPGIALAPDGSIYAGVSAKRAGDPAGILRLNPAALRGVSLDRIANAFSDDTHSVAAGGLYSLTGSAFNRPSSTLGSTPRGTCPPNSAAFAWSSTVYRQRFFKPVRIESSSQRRTSRRSSPSRRFSSSQTGSHPTLPGCLSPARPPGCSQSSFPISSLAPISPTGTSAMKTAR